MQTYGKSLGETAFDAYAASTEGKTHDGKKIPEWSKLSDETRAAWEAAGSAVHMLATNNRGTKFTDHRVPPPLPRV